jgi:hypothetical protein
MLYCCTFARAHMFPAWLQQLSQLCGGAETAICRVRAMRTVGQEPYRLRRFGTDVRAGAVTERADTQAFESEIDSDLQLPGNRRFLSDALKRAAALTVTGYQFSLRARSWWPPDYDQAGGNFEEASTDSE